MFSLSQTPGRTAIVGGKEHLFFSGYSYLGMGYVPAFIDLVKEGIDKYGWMFPSSRISNTQLELFTNFENKLSEITGMEETVCFSSGFLAGRAVADLFRNENFSCAPQTHPAICLEKSSAQSYDEWKKDASNYDVLFLDSVNPLTADINDLSFLTSTSNKTIIIDDSHGAGLINNGSGASIQGHHEFVLTYSLSKAYNLVGGAVSCSKEIAEQLRASAFYIASTSLSPALAYAFLKAQDLYEQQREKLRNNIKFFRQLTKNKFKSHPELPIFILDGVSEEKLQEKNIIISSFAYPDPTGNKINRAVLNALHTQDDLQRLADVLNGSH